MDNDQRSIAMFVVFWFVRELVLGKKRPVHPFIFDCEGKAGTGKSKDVIKSIHLIKSILVESNILTLEEVESRIIMITHNGLAASIAGIDTFDSKVVNTRGLAKSINRKFDQVLLTVTDEYSGMPGNKNMLLHTTFSSEYFGSLTKKERGWYCSFQWSCPAEHWRYSTKDPLLHPTGATLPHE
jgi:hypothetical protein